MKKPKSKRKWQSIGTFEVTSGKIIVSDPCYERGTWCQKENIRAANGKWRAFITRDPKENRVAALMVLGPGGTRTAAWKETDWEVGVDSGQAGVFDQKLYKGDDREFDKEKGWVHKEGESWYEQICELTCGRMDGVGAGAGVVNGGAVSLTGYGDGGYPAYKQTKDGKVTAVLIDYIDEFLQCRDCDTWMDPEKMVDSCFCSKECAEKAKDEVA